MYQHRGCKSIYQPLSYPSTSLRKIGTWKHLGKDIYSEEKSVSQGGIWTVNFTGTQSSISSFDSKN